MEKEDTECNFIHVFKFYHLNVRYPPLSHFGYSHTQDNQDNLLPKINSNFVSSKNMTNGKEIRGPGNIYIHIVPMKVTINIINCLLTLTTSI